MDINVFTKEELKLFRESKHLTQEQLGSMLGFHKNYIGMLENPADPKTNKNISRNISVKFMEKLIQKFPDALSYKNEQEIVSDKYSNIIPIPLYNIGAACGAGTWLADVPNKDVMYFDKRFLKQILKTENYSGLHIIHASGDSMDSGWNQPNDIKDGDLLLVDTQQTTGNNQTFVILVNNSELRVKRLFKRGDALYISSNNPKYKEEIYYPDNNDFEVKVIGKVVWNGSKETI